MSSRVEQLVDEFCRLSAAEQQQAVREMLGRVRSPSSPRMDDASLTELAESIFAIYDAEESNGAT
jgi:hypothetical protein